MTQKKSLFISLTSSFVSIYSRNFFSVSSNHLTNTYNSIILYVLQSNCSFLMATRFIDYLYGGACKRDKMPIDFI